MNLSQSQFEHEFEQSISASYYMDIFFRFASTSKIETMVQIGSTIKIEQDEDSGNNECPLSPIAHNVPEHVIVV